MDDLDHIERRLRESLVPRGFTDRGVQELNALIDGLAGEEESTSSRRWIWVTGMAAAVVGAAGLAWNAMPARPVPLVVRTAPQPGIQLVSTSEGVVSAERAGDWLAEEDGSLLEGWHVRVVNEERFHDEATGQTVRVLHPRDEWVMMPVSTF
ncbi:hypothetical protein HNR46_002029 [Haloferula luteola]|uniref:Uncharacterized protein n=1 Tax=Haloferula luteola TaxID=595692 RepID=A0A840VD21_9BACT|nr:hypothetical protein [Haloferula luteola]MBB5351790.1 hypothetical protein [Haloferula luteola]